MVVHLGVFLKRLIPNIVETLICLSMQITLEEKYFFDFFIGELLLLCATMWVLFTPNFFFLVQYRRGVVPLELVFVITLVPCNTFHEALVINVKAIANSVAGLTVLILLRIYGFHHHLAVFRRWSGYHCNWILGYVVQTLIRQLVKPLGYTQIRMLLDYTD